MEEIESETTFPAAADAGTMRRRLGEAVNRLERVVMELQSEESRENASQGKDPYFTSKDELRGELEDAGISESDLVGTKQNGGVGQKDLADAVSYLRDGLEPEEVIERQNADAEEELEQREE